MMEIKRNVRTGAENTFARCIPDLGHRHFTGYAAAITIVSDTNNSVISGLFITLNYLPYIRVQKSRPEHPNKTPPRKVIVIVIVPDFTPGPETSTVWCGLRNPH